MMRRTVRGWLAAAGLAAAVAAGSPAAAKPAKPLFAGAEVIHLTIQAPLGQLTGGAANLDKTIPGSLTVQGAAPETLPVSLSLRGLTRRRKEVCSFPPLRVEFPARPPESSLFKGQKRLKLVTHCQPQAGFQQYVLLEYAAYRMYNQLTPASFDVRLASIDYVDRNGRPITSRLGFFIEDADDMAARNELQRYKTQGRVPAGQLRPRDAARLVVFEYMIGNLDWAITAGPAGTDCCHNSRLLGAKGAATDLIPVPYDFDFSGLVDAPYAVPPDGMSLTSVRTRRYRGFCRHNGEAQAAAADLVARRAALLAVLDETPQLDERTRRKAAGYLGGFFDQAASPREAPKLVQTCLG